MRKVVYQSMSEGAMERENERRLTDGDAGAWDFCYWGIPGNDDDGGIFIIDDDYYFSMLGNSEDGDSDIDAMPHDNSFDPRGWVHSDDEGGSDGESVDDDTPLPCRNFEADLELLDILLESIGKRPIDCGGDGACLFKSIAKCLHLVDPQLTHLTHVQVRADIVEELSLNREKYFPDIPDASEQQQYLSNMAMRGEWGTDREVSAAVARYNIRVRVHTVDQGNSSDSTRIKSAAPLGVGESLPIIEIANISQVHWVAVGRAEEVGQAGARRSESEGDAPGLGEVSPRTGVRVEVFYPEDLERAGNGEHDLGGVDLGDDAAGRWLSATIVEVGASGDAKVEFCDDSKETWVIPSGLTSRLIRAAGTRISVGKSLGGQRKVQSKKKNATADSASDVTITELLASARTVGAPIVKDHDSMSWLYQAACKPTGRSHSEESAKTMDKFGKLAERFEGGFIRPFVFPVVHMGRAKVRPHCYTTSHYCTPCTAIFFFLQAIRERIAQ